MSNKLEKPQLNVLIVDDHWIARAAIAHLLPKLHSAVNVTEASSADEAISLTENGEDFDLIVLDLNMPGYDIWKAIGTLKKTAPIIVMSVSEERADVLRCLQEGAFGYVPKTALPDTILKTIKRVLNGEVALPQRLLVSETAKDQSPIADDEQLVDISAALEEFTPRQKEIFAMLSTGADNRDIARKLELSVNTVRAHMQAITSKLKVKNRATLALYSSRWHERLSAA